MTTEKNPNKNRGSRAAEPKEEPIIVKTPEDLVQEVETMKLAAAVRKQAAVDAVKAAAEAAKAALDAANAEEISLQAEIATKEIEARNSAVASINKILEADPVKMGKFTEFVQNNNALETIEHERQAVADRIKDLSAQILNLTSKKASMYADLYAGLAGSGVKESLIPMALGKKPEVGKVYVAKAPAAADGTKAPRAKAEKIQFPDGTLHSWVDYGLAVGFSRDVITGKGVNARRIIEKQGKLQAGYTAVEV